ncbi:MAG: GWxTD domain-containing protein [Candidatus Marinimicrobia bacterium]|nr:GWxTD domain-containing protein [Candidatus Neomarinimicrobiota bacterium]
MKYLLIFSILWGSIALAGQYTLKGYVYDGETGYGIPDVQVFLSDSSRGVLTDKSGYFIFDQLDRVNEIFFNHIKYYTITRPIVFGRSPELFTSFNLFDKTLILDSVVVYGNAFFPGRNEVKFSPVKSLFYSDKYKQYKQMLKEGNWSWLELVTYGFWLMADEKVFKEYWKLSSKSDRETFLKLFWLNNDPTPGTKKNELKEEFDRRLRYNWTHFSQVDSSGIMEKRGKVVSLIDQTMGKKFGSDAFKAKSENRLRPWTKRAPWDARGEIFLKYGEPSQISIQNNRSKDWTQSDLDFEDWYYASLGVDFRIKKYSSNIEGNEIQPGERSMRLLESQAKISALTSPQAAQMRRLGDGNTGFSDQNTLVEMENEMALLIDNFRTKFVENKTFYYEYQTQKKISDLHLTFINNSLVIQFTPMYYKSIKNENFYSLISIQYEIRKAGDVMKEKSLPYIRTVKSDEIQTFRIPFDLPSGNYEMELYIEDHNANRMVQEKSPLVIK